MSSLEARLALEADAVARTVDAAQGPWLAELVHVSRSRRRARTAVAVVSAVGIVLASAFGLTLLLGRGQEPATDLSPSPTLVSLSPDDESPSPSASAPAPESAMVDGFAPVPQFTSSAVPWDEVGPGWFVVVYRSDIAEGESSHDYGQSVVIPQLTGGISLLSPDGDWYAVTTVESLGAGLPMDWDGRNIWMARTVVPGPDEAYFGADLLGLADGKFAGSVQAETLESLTTVGPGVALDYAWSEDGRWNSAVGPATEGMGGCQEAGSGYWGWHIDDMGFLYSPADGGKLVCFGPAADSTHTDVTLVNVGDVAKSAVVNQFKFDVSRYTFVGWVDSRHFLLARTNPSSLAAEALFSYSLDDDSLEELPFNPYTAVRSGEVRGFLDAASQHHVILSHGSDEWRLQLFELDGTAVGEASGSCAGDPAAPEFGVSGGLMTLQCRASGTLTLIDLADGAEVGSWELGSTMWIDVYDHPDT